MRPPFLPLAVVCVFLGMSVAIWTDGDINIWYAVLCFVGGILAHGGVNAFNDMKMLKADWICKPTARPSAEAAERWFRFRPR